MSFANIKTKLQAQEGFTIVELLIVIVVIAILAAITIVSYNGITARANTSSAQAAASTVIKKAEAYASDATTNGYPTTLAALNSAPASSPYALSGITLTTTAVSATQTTGPGTVNLYACPTATSPTGMKAAYWDFSAGAPAVINTGAATGTTTTGCVKL